MSNQHRHPKIPGSGTHNRPWILDDVEDDDVVLGFDMASHSRRASSSSDARESTSSYDRYLASRQRQQQRQQATTSNNGRSASTTFHRSSSTGAAEGPSQQQQQYPRSDSDSGTTGSRNCYSSMQYDEHQRVAAAAAPPLSPVKSRSSTHRDVSSTTASRRRRMTGAAADSSNILIDDDPSGGVVFQSRRSSSDAAVGARASAGDDAVTNDANFRRRRSSTGASSSRRLMSTKVMSLEESGESAQSSLRDLRSRRLSQQRRTNKNEHFQAHDAAVERYLRRKEQQQQQTVVRQSDETLWSSNKEPAAIHQTASSTTTRVMRKEGDSVTLHQYLRSDDSNTDIRRPSSNSRPATTTSHVKKATSQQQQTSTTSAPRHQQDDATTTTKGGWSTLKRTSNSGRTSLTVPAVAAADRYQASLEKERMMASSPAGSGSAKVDEYLAARSALKQKSSSLVRLGKTNNKSEHQQQQPSIPAAQSTESSGGGATLSISTVAAAQSVSFEATSSDSSSAASDCSDAEPDNFVDDGSSIDDDDDDAKEWSVRVCIVSAVDFPASVVPNLPFSPFLKVGLVKLKSTGENPQGEDAGKMAVVAQSCEELASTIEQEGLSSIRRARVLCTSSKILSKRDNGSVEFHEEMRWDGVKHPQQMAVAVELSSRAVMTPANIRESPPPQKVSPFELPSSTHSSIGHGQTPQRGNTYASDTASGASGLGSLFRKIRKTDSTEMEEANAAAAVAKLLVQGEGSRQEDQKQGSGPLFDSKSLNFKAISGSQSEINVKLRKRKRRANTKMTDELRLGSNVVPLSRLPLNKAINGNETARIEQWFQLETSQSTNTALTGTSPTSSTANRNPSILLEISFSAPEVLDDSEDEMDEENEGTAELKASYSKRASIKIRNQLKQEVKPKEVKIEEPVLEPGVIDYICVVGARDIGDQKADDGARGWVNSVPECCILEQFPPNEEFHVKNGRSAVLPGKVEWFCMPEGCRLWRGLTPPNHDELNLKRFSASSPAQVSTSVASFDACLGCTTSFSWFVIASNSDQYGSESTKTFGAVIRFFVPAPTGIDSTQDDFAQTMLGNQPADSGEGGERKRLWVPIGICLTSSMPIIGAMEVMLLRMCEALSANGVLSAAPAPETRMIHEGLASLIVNCQKPIPGVVNCSLPFLGERLHIALSPRRCLPPLPHGNAIASVCRLLGADGMNYLLAAFLTECKILLHSDDVANICLVAEVLTALIYPFQWSLPYVPVLPQEMMEFIEAPLSFLLGVPSCNMDLVDPNILEDIVVVDLDRDFSTSDYYEGRRNGMKTKSPVPLPAATASNISKAVYHLLRAQEEVEESIGSSSFPGSGSFPRLEQESLPEREFRISVALEVCGLIRGFDDCLVFSSSQPVFNVDKFLQTAPAVFEEQRAAASGGGQPGTRRVISPRSRRFVSLLVCCQHFHQFLEVLESESLAFFQLVMRSLDTKSARNDQSLAGRLLSLDTDKTVGELCHALQTLEDRIPTYRVKCYAETWSAALGSVDKEKCDRSSSLSQFPLNLLQQIVVDGASEQKDSGSEGVTQVSVEYLVELTKNPWRYQKLFDIKICNSSESIVPPVEKIKLKEAIGDRRYRVWKSSAGYDKSDADEASLFSEDSRGLTVPLDLKSLLTSCTEDVTLSSSDDAGVNASDRCDSRAQDTETIRRCLEWAVSADGDRASTNHSGHDFVDKAENAMQKPSAQKFLLSVLSRRAQNNSDKKGESTPARRHSLHSGASKLDAKAFEVFVRLAFAMLDSCLEIEDFESAYSLLKLCGGLYMTSLDDKDMTVTYLTGRIGLHPIYANLRVWEKVRDLHAKNRQQHSKPEAERQNEDEDYEAVVATLYEMNGYGIPAEELARFASRMCEHYGWYNSERGQTLLVLARRVGLRRDQNSSSFTPCKMSDLELISPSPRKPGKNAKKKPENCNLTHTLESRRGGEDARWIETGWCHPAAQSSRRVGTGESVRRPVVQTLIPSSTKESGNHMKRAAVTSMAYLGSSVVVSGGLDGGVFMARRVSDDSERPQEGNENSGIRGVHLDWGSSGSRYTIGSVTTSLDGEYGVGAVTCLAATRSPHSSLIPRSAKSPKNDVVDVLEDEEILEAMEGCRVVAGTTCGDLRVWSVKDVFSAVFYASSGGDTGPSVSDTTFFQHGAGGSTSSFVSGRRGKTDFSAGSSMTRLKFSLRGRALSGHRGGVSCIDVHSNVYRPDSIVSGGADGLIKLWSLRSPGTSAGRKSSADLASSKSITPNSNDSLTPRSKAARSGDALNILSGHGGRVLCVKTAWHGDRLLSGGADRTVRLWDLTGSGGKCLNSLSGHYGWVTSVHYWGPNTIISASTDRSVALWDTRVRNSPLFTLRHHFAPVSDLLVGPRTDPVVISAATDGRVAAWDFRHLAGSDSSLPPSTANGNDRFCHSVRNPAGTLYLHNFNRKRQVLGPVRLSRGVSRHRKTALCLGGDGIVREWDHESGEIVDEHTTGHCDTISSFISLGGDKVLDNQLDSSDQSTTATITASWDGTVRMRCLRS